MGVGRCDTEGWIPKMVSVIQRVGSQGGGGGKCDTEGWILRMVSVIQRGGSRVGRDGVVSVIYRGVDPKNGKCDTEGWISGGG